MNKNLLEAYRLLKELEEHHVQLNVRVGRPESHSKTLRLTRAAMAEIAELIPPR